MSKVDRIVRRVRARMTKVMMLILVCWALIAALIMADSLLQGRPLLAAATLPALAVAATLSWRIHAISLGLRDLRRRIATPSPAPAPHPSLNPPRTTEEKLRQIGMFRPQRASGTSPGRQAAAVSVDADAPFRLVAATQRTNGSARVGRSLVVVGSDQLIQRLSQHGTVRRLHPSMSTAEMAKADPDVLIIEEDSFDSGPWDGTLQPHGGKLLLELRVAMATMRRLQRPTYIIATTRMPEVATAFLRADANLVDDAFSDDVLRDDGPSSLLTTLASHRRESAGGLA